MTLHWHDFAGTAGVVMIIGAYFLIQTGRLTAMQLTYILLNLVGALLILLSLLFDFNLSAFLMEIAWVVISLMGMRRLLMERRMGGNAPS
jgi:hypothetical protein